MSSAVLRAALRQRFTSWTPLLLLIATSGISLSTIAIAPSRGLHSLRSGTAVVAFVLILGGGMIGQDLRSGVLQLVFARPLRRSTYVLQKWLAAALGSALSSIVTVLIGALMVLALGSRVTPAELLQLLGSCVLLAVSLSAVLTFLSSIFTGYGDCAIWVAGMGASQIVAGLAASKRWPIVERVAEEVSRFLMPVLDLGDPLGAWSLSWFSIISYASTTTLCLALAIAIVNGRELSYAQS